MAGVRLTWLVMLAMLVPGPSLGPPGDYQLRMMIDRVEEEAARELAERQAEQEAAQALEEAVAERERERAASAAEPEPGPSVWTRLADCESGNWVDGGASFEVGSARWDWAAPGATVPPWGTSIHHGGLQFLPATWDWVAPMVGLGHLPHAYDGTPEEQIRVAERLLELQGWEAWPVCSRKLGLR